MKIQSFEEFMQDEFMDLREINGVPIIKDNYEDMFDGWISNLDGEEYFKFAQKYGEKQYLDGMDKVLTGFKPYVENLRDIMNTKPFNND